MANYNQLKTRAQQVRDEQTIGGNTALRVGQLLMDMVDAESETVDNIVEMFTGTEDNPVISTLPNPGLLHWLQSPIVALVSMGEALDGDAGAVVQEGDLYYYNHSGYQIFVKGAGGLPGTGYKARQKVLYLNKYTGKLYEWTGADMSEIVLAATGGGGSIIKDVKYEDGYLVITFDTEQGDEVVSVPVDFDASNYVPITRTVNGKALSQNITLSQSDISGLVDALAAKVSGIKVNNGETQTPTNGVVNLEIQGGSSVDVVDNLNSTDGTKALSAKQGKVLDEKIAGKQDTLTFDNAPTANSNNVVKSGGIKDALDNLLQNLTIGTNGNWFVGQTDTNVKAQGPQGDSTITDLNDVMTRIVNNLTTGGGANILSAEMGKVLKTAIETLMNSIGEYAFPNGRPTLSWQGTMHTIDQTGLSHVTSDCALASIADGSSLTIQLTADTNYTLDTVIVTMGGVDITATAYNSGTGVITINTVTGPIVITATAVLPYDAEIEYLESSGTQWIDTGIAVTGDGFKTEIKADAQAADSGWRNIIGARDASARYGIPFGLKPTDSGGTWYSQYGLGSYGNGVVADDSSSAGSGLHTMVSELSGNNAYLTIDGTKSSAYCPSNTYRNLPSLTLYLFGTHREDSTVQSISEKVYYCKIWNGGELVFDAIPVRVGQVGYMYDKVSGELLGNIGTGSFTLGNDLTV